MDERRNFKTHHYIWIKKMLCKLIIVILVRLRKMNYFLVSFFYHIINVFLELCLFATKYWELVLYVSDC